MKAVFLITVSFLFTFGIPTTNEKVIEFVDTVIGKKVARGECWDLASAALEYAGAFLDRSSQKSLYVFGKEIRPEKETVLPGDIIQIENVKIEYTEGNMIYSESMIHHTAIIYEVLDKDVYQIAHQNTSFSGRKVGISILNKLHLQINMTCSEWFLNPYAPT